MRSDNSKIKDIFKDLSFSEDEIKIIESVFHKTNYKKGTLLLRAEVVTNIQYYI
jgi:hypothetical protein